MANRNDLHEILTSILGSKNVYFRSPESIKMSYPAIRYIDSDPIVTYANNKKYGKRKCYILTIIDKNPDSEIPEKIEALPYTSFDRSYISDGLNHYVYKIYF